MSLDLHDEFKEYAIKHMGISSLQMHYWEQVQNEIYNKPQVYNSVTPMVLEERELRVTMMSVFDRMMMDRIIWLAGPVNDRMSTIVQAQLMFLDNLETKDITLHVDSPGGSVKSGLSIVDVMDYVASILEIKPIEVYEVASFYSMYNLKPVGKCLLEVCQTGPCMLNGADDLVAHFKKKLNIKVGETTEDGMFTLKTVECLGSCGTAPMLQCGADYHENLDESKADALIEKLRAENKRSRYC